MSEVDNSASPLRVNVDDSLIILQNSLHLMRDEKSELNKLTNPMIPKDGEVIDIAIEDEVIISSPRKPEGKKKQQDQRIEKRKKLTHNKSNKKSDINIQTEQQQQQSSSQINKIETKQPVNDSQNTGLFLPEQTELESVIQEEKSPSNNTTIMKGLVQNKVKKQPSSSENEEDEEDYFDQNLQGYCEQSIQNHAGMAASPNSQFKAKHTPYSVLKSSLQFQYQNTPQMKGQNKKIKQSMRLSHNTQQIMAIQHKKEQGIKRAILYIITIGKLYRFIRKLQEKSSIYLLKNMQKNHFHIINDKSYEKPNKNMVKFDLSRLEVFDPHGKFSVTWNICKLLIIIIQIFLIPMRAAFKEIQEKEYTFQVLHDIFLLSISMLDIAMTFNKGVYKQGFLIKDRKQISKQYIKTDLPIDFLGTFAFILNIITSKYNQFGLLIFLVRIKQISRIVNYLDNIFQMEAKHTAIYQLNKLFLIIFFVAHICGVIFYTVAKVEMDHYQEENTWIQSKEYQDFAWNKIYVESLYYAFITMVTVGYGDISPTTYTEKLVVIFLTLISCGVFAYSVNTIDIIVRDNQEKDARIKMKKFKVSTYMSKRNISKEKQMKIIKALEYIDEQEEEENLEGYEILKSISTNIQDNILLEYFGNVIRDSKLALHGKYSREFLDALTLKVQECTVGPGTQLYTQCEYGGYFYILIEGSVEFNFINKNKTDSQNKMFKELRGKSEIIFSDFYKEEFLDFSVKTTSVSRLVYFSKFDFLEQVKKFPIDYQKFCNIRDSIVHNSTAQNISCYICNSYCHSSVNCPYVHLNLYKLKIIEQHRSTQPNTRKRYLRRLKYTLAENNYNARGMQFYIRGELMRYRQQLIEEQINEIVPYNLDDFDIDFFYNQPKLQFIDQDNYVCHIECNEEDENFFEFEYEELVRYHEEQELFQKQGSEVYYNRNNDKRMSIRLKNNSQTSIKSMVLGNNAGDVSIDRGQRSLTNEESSEQSSDDTTSRNDLSTIKQPHQQYDTQSQHSQKGTSYHHNQGFGNLGILNQNNKQPANRSNESGGRKQTITQQKQTMYTQKMRQSIMYNPEQKSKEAYNKLLWLQNKKRAGVTQNMAIKVCNSSTTTNNNIGKPKGNGFIAQIIGQTNVNDQKESFYKMGTLKNMNQGGSNLNNGQSHFSNTNSQINNFIKLNSTLTDQQCVRQKTLSHTNFDNAQINNCGGNNTTYGNSNRNIQMDIINSQNNYMPNHHKGSVFQGQVIDKQYQEQLLQQEQNQIEAKRLFGPDMDRMKNFQVYQQLFNFEVLKTWCDDIRNQVLKMKYPHILKQEKDKGKDILKEKKKFQKNGKSIQYNSISQINQF